jgi:EamA-like transporter family
MNFGSWQESWQVWAVLSAMFAALTAIFAKIGVENINSDMATFIRTVVVLFSFLVLLFATTIERAAADTREPAKQCDDEDDQNDCAYRHSTILFANRFWWRVVRNVVVAVDLRWPTIARESVARKRRLRSARATTKR